jgi:hypothetical protein
MLGAMTDDQLDRRRDPIAAGPRFQDLRHALHAVDVEIDRYESTLRATFERRLGLGSEIEKLRAYREEILEKLKAIP